MDPLLILFGFGVGLLVGATGMGGGALMTPLLILLFSVRPVLAIGTDLAYAAVTKTVGGWRHLRKGTVDVRLALWLCAGSVPGAIGGVYLLERLHAAYGDGIDTFVLLTLAGALATVGLLVLVRAIFLPRLIARERQSVDMDLRHKLAATALGLAVGFVLGITSAGSGTLIAVGLIILFRLAPRRVVGTDIFHAAILLWVAGLAHFVSGNVDLLLAATLLLGSIPGVWIGTNVATRLPERSLRPALGIVMITASLGLLTKVGVDLPAYVLVLVPIVLGIVTWWLLDGRQRSRGAASLPATEQA